mmetsp:Transcript_28902/g.78308  ORF Transcript_28902/g.78308 Transcript_28902/m.78308 type:complete len:104 (-) Transcript_28902:252-563(-)
MKIEAPPFISYHSLPNLRVASFQIVPSIAIQRIIDSITLMNIHDVFPYTNFPRTFRRAKPFWFRQQIPSHVSIGNIMKVEKQPEQNQGRCSDLSNNSSVLPFR